jgi:osmotically-inducible protein OsmY
VKGVANELQVALASSGRRTDTDIAQTAVHALEWNTSVPKDRIKVAVRNAWVTLDGEVEWQFQRMAADHAVRGLPGVYGVTNMITVKPGVTPTDIKSRIENALRRAAEVDAKHVTVQADGSRVTLAGNVRSWAERDDAENAAWSAPGVTDVTNRIRIEDNVALGV